MKELKSLISVKKIIALLLTSVFCYLAITKTIAPNDFMTVFLMIVSFYFGQSTIKDVK